MVFEPHNLTRHADFVRFSDANGTDYEAYGDDSRLQLAYDVAESIATIGKLATDLLYDFMRHKGTFELSFVEVFATPEDDGGVGRLRYCFTPTDAGEDFGYTYFDVVLTIAEHAACRFMQNKLVVGFW